MGVPHCQEETWALPQERQGSHPLQDTGGEDLRSGLLSPPFRCWQWSLGLPRARIRGRGQGVSLRRLAFPRG